MVAKITHMWGNWEYYFVRNRWRCRDESDKAAYDMLEESGQKAVQVGKVCAERIEEESP